MCEAYTGSCLCRNIIGNSGFWICWIMDNEIGKCFVSGYRIMFGYGVMFFFVWNNAGYLFCNVWMLTSGWILDDVKE